MDLCLLTLATQIDCKHLGAKVKTFRTLLTVVGSDVWKEMLLSRTSCVPTGRLKSFGVEIDKDKLEARVGAMFTLQISRTDISRAY